MRKNKLLLQFFINKFPRKCKRMCMNLQKWLDKLSEIKTMLYTNQLQMVYYTFILIQYRVI